MLGLKTIDNMDDYSVYTVLGNDTTNLAASAKRLTGSYSLEFDKVDGAAGKTYAGAYRTISLNLTKELLQIHDMLSFAVYISDLTNVASAYVKLGDDATNNLEFNVADTALAAGWKLCGVSVGNATMNGTGWNPANIVYMEVGVNFDGEANALADLKFDSVIMTAANYTRT
jgi:hypothetical protein